MKKRVDVCGVWYMVEKRQGIKYIALYFDDDIRKSTIGCYEGEIVCKAFRCAMRRKIPLVAFVSSAGIRITEGTSALIQMAKIAQVVTQHSKKKLLFICVIENLVLGGVNASLVALADIIIGKQNAIYGFAGKRIVKSTTLEKLPNDFQTVEYAQKHGMIDIVVMDNQINNIITILLQMHERKIWKM